ncbi:hypothetical protein [Coleofasciculus sp.]|uniref:hypothetical protein n=1 Tax=Coleofasciculus sp. TaxID=3100458 RepID=UPI003A2295E3
MTIPLCSIVGLSFPTLTFQVQRSAVAHSSLMMSRPAIASPTPKIGRAGKLAKP